MTVELTFYIFLLFVSIAFTVKRVVIRNTLIFNFLYYIIIASLSLIVRTSGFDVDMKVYVLTMEKDIQEMSSIFYYYKEPIVWLGQSLSFSLFKSHIAVLFMYDMILAIIIHVVLTSLKASQYIYFSFYLFFPVVLGYQNIYRQNVATILLLLSLMLILKKKWLSSSIVFFITLLSHNSTAIFFPLFILLRKYKGYFIILYYLSVLFVYFIITYGGNLKSTVETGRSLEYMYVFIQFLLLCFLYFRSEKYYLKLFFFLFSLTLVSSLSLSSGISERIGMYGLTIMYVLFSIPLENQVRQKVLIRMLYTLLPSLLLFFDPLYTIITSNLSSP